MYLYIYIILGNFLKCSNQLQTMYAINTALAYSQYACRATLNISYTTNKKTFLLFSNAGATSRHLKLLIPL